jgi:hypothetical protein
MDKETEQFLKYVSEHILDGSLSLAECQRFVDIAFDNPEIYVFLLKILKDIGLEKEAAEQANKLDEDGYKYFLAYSLERYGAWNKQTRDSLTGGLDNFEFITKNIVFIIYNLLGKYKEKYSLFDLAVIALFTDLKLYVDDGDFDVDSLVDKTVKLFEDGVLSLDLDDYDIRNIINSISPSVNNFILAISMLAYALATKVDCPDSEEKDIVSTVIKKAPTLEEFIDKTLKDEKSIRESEIVRVKIEMALEEIECNELIHFGEHDDAISYFDIDDLDDFYFVDFLKNPLGDEFSTDMIINFFKKTDHFYDHNQEHEEYLRHLNSTAQQVKDALLEQDPNLNAQKVILCQSSDDAEDNALAGLCNLYGVFVKQNFEKAFYCFKDASAKLHPEATYQLSVLYLKSIFVRFDLEKWIDNLAKAVRLGDENAISQWKEVEDTYKQIRNTYPQYFDS